jgi:hypothetical protein
MPKPTKDAGAISLAPRARSAAQVGALSLPPQSGTVQTASAAMPTAINLSGKHKAIFLIGRGRIGKNIAHGRMATGVTANAADVRWALAAVKRPTAYIELVWSADKSVSAVPQGQAGRGRLPGVRGAWPGRRRHRR